MLMFTQQGNDEFTKHDRLPLEALPYSDRAGPGTDSSTHLQLLYYFLSVTESHGVRSDQLSSAFYELVL